MHWFFGLGLGARLTTLSHKKPTVKETDTTQARATAGEAEMMLLSQSQ